MNMPMCSRCKKNIAVVFITKIEGPDKTTQEGLCLKCARELGVKPLDNIMEQMGIAGDDLDMREKIDLHYKFRYQPE